MKISRLDNIGFGYSKELNKKFVARLKGNTDNPINSALLQINSSCNTTENIIKSLSKKYDENELLINILLGYFKEAKIFICSVADRLFPDLNYTKTEADAYDNEILEEGWEESYDFDFSEEGEVQTSSENLKKEYKWLEDVFLALSKIANNGEDINSEDDTNDDYYKNADYDKADELLDEYDKLSKDNATKNKENSVLQKYIPMSHSPKSIDEVVGLDKSINDIKNFILYPIEHPEEASQREKDYGIDIPHFIVFHGPPGCGKTMLAEAIAAETGADMYLLNLSSVGSKYVNQTVINVSNAFEEIYKEAENSAKPVIVFIDEMDSLLSQRTSNSDVCPEDKKVVNTMLPILTSAKDKNIIIIGATNMYDTIDKAVKRRIDMNAYIGLPKKEEIALLLERQLEKIKKGQVLASDKEKIEDLSKQLTGYSPANIVSIVKSAAKECFINNKEIEKEDILNALKSGTYEKIKESEYMPESMKTKRTVGFN